MKIIVNKIVGELLFRGYGNGRIEKAWSKIVVNEPFELYLDNQEFAIDTVSLTPEGELVVYASVGDEQISSNIYIFRKGWKIIQEEREIPVLTFEEFDSFFERRRIGNANNYRSGVPDLLKDLFPDQNESKDI